MNHQRTLERFLKPGREVEGYQVSEMHGRRGRTSARVQVDGTRSRGHLDLGIVRISSSSGAALLVFLLLQRRRAHAVPALQQFANLFDIAMAEEDLPSQESMQPRHGAPLHRDIFESAQNVRREGLGAKLFNELGVVDGSRDFEGRDDHLIFVFLAIIIPIGSSNFVVGIV